MSQDKRTLTDELNSVLIAHSLQAPEPARTIEQVLARVADQKPYRIRPKWLRAPRHLNNFIAAAVVIGLVFAGAVALRSHSSSSPTSASAAAATGAPASGAPAVGAAVPKAAAPVVGNMPASGGPLSSCSPVGRTVSGLRFGSQSPGIVEQFCGPMSADSTTSSSQNEAAYGSSLTITPDDVVPNQLAVTGQSPVTLIDSSQHLQVMSVTAVKHTVTVRALDSEGNLQELTFTSKDGHSFTRTSDTTIAKACTLGDLSVALVKPASVPGGALVGLVTVTDVSGGAPCALSGYPDIQAAAAEIPSAAVIDAVHTLAGPDGGVKKSTAVPVIVLASGQRASAIVESLAKTSPPCGSTGILTISLPQIGVVRDYADFPLGLCNLEVHPLVPGSSGSD